MRLAVHGRERCDVAKRTDRPSDDLGAVRLAAILEHLDAAGMGVGDDLVDLGGLTGIVDNNDRRHVGPEPLAHLRSVDVVAVLLAVAQPRLQPVENDRAQCPGIGDGRDQHFAALGQVERRDRDIKRRRAGRDAVGVAAAHHGNEAVGIEFFESTLVARIDLPFPIVGDRPPGSCVLRPRRSPVAAACALAVRDRRRGSPRYRCACRSSVPPTQCRSVGKSWRCSSRARRGDRHGCRNCG